LCLFGGAVIAWQVARLTARTATVLPTH
jgi:hypothetical protein